MEIELNKKYKVKDGYFVLNKKLHLYKGGNDYMIAYELEIFDESNISYLLSNVSENRIYELLNKGANSEK